MNSLTDRVILIILGISTILTQFDEYHSIIALVLCISLTSVLEYLSNLKFSSTVFISFCIICILSMKFIFFLPLLIYDISSKKTILLGVTAIIPMIIHIDELGINNIILILSFFVTAYILRYKTFRFNEISEKFKIQRDTLTEMSIQLENKVDLLLEKQDNDVKIATLNERNRIAKEIHDNVGHLLSSAILQLGALITIIKDNSVKDPLLILKDTLSEGMNSVRESVHNLRDDSFDLYIQLKKLTEEFTFCDITFDYNITNQLEIKQRYAVIAIVKEALANIIKHSDASIVTISLYEHPKLFQIIISDNGKKANKYRNDNFDIGNGMGLENIKQRVYSCDGHINITVNDGFRIFVSLPKMTDYTNHNQ